jgi:hypothetical protein
MLHLLEIRLFAKIAAKCTYNRNIFEHLQEKPCLKTNKVLLRYRQILALSLLGQFGASFAEISASFSANLLSAI